MTLSLIRCPKCGEQMKELYTSVFCDCPDVPRCPKCKSADIEPFEVMDWFLNPDMRTRCVPCGHVWK